MAVHNNKPIPELPRLSPCGPGSTIRRRKKRELFDPARSLSAASNFPVVPGDLQRHRIWVRSRLSRVHPVQTRVDLGHGIAHPTRNTPARDGFLAWLFTNKTVTPPVASRPRSKTLIGVVRSIFCPD
jgi:hypothetical protein